MTASLSPSIVPTTEYLDDLPEHTVIIIADSSGVPVSPPRIYVKDGVDERNTLRMMNRMGVVKPTKSEDWATVGFLGRSTSQEVVDYAEQGTILVLAATHSEAAHD